MEKYICIHGHFYQPPRENPWLEEVEVQDSAYPYRDWNERINAECYAPNTASRIKSGDGKIIDIINNYTKMSFNFGPTLLSWMETNAPETYQSIVKADVESREKYSGHGSAIAQVYNHMIMPLANTRDKRTQVIWGIEDFRYRFGREPEGMWLAETAVDIESLETLAELGIKFTILAPNQAKRVRHINNSDWGEVNNGNIDTKKNYICQLPSGRTINLFFYNGDISQELAFGDLLKNGSNLSSRLTGTFTDNDEPQIVNIATDGETYGHYQKYGDMALAFCMHNIDVNDTEKLTVYGEFLEKFPPQWEVEIAENISWSCSHGIERWRSNCGCNSGRNWSQEWRAPLREALDWLREQLIPLYEKGLNDYVNDPWKLRDEYIKVILNRDPENIENFFSGMAKKNLNPEDKIKILKYLEMQRHAMLMYTSCGWFFDEISGIETVQVIMYAARAIQLAKDLTNCDFEPEFIDLLKNTPSNIPEINNGAYAYENYVKPAVVDLYRVTAHYAISTLFNDYKEYSRIYCYEVNNFKFERMEAGRAKLVKGMANLKSRITYEEKTVTYSVAHLGDQNVVGGVRDLISDEAFQEMDVNLNQLFEKNDVAGIVLVLDKYFGTHNYTLWHLFKDESRRVFDILLKDTLENIEHTFRQTYEDFYPVMTAIVNSHLPLPNSFLTAVEFVLNADIRKIFVSPDGIQDEDVEKIISEVNKWSVRLDIDTLSHASTKKINSLMDRLANDPKDIILMKDVEDNMKLVRKLNIPANLWKSQNVLFLIYRDIYSVFKSKANRGDKTSKEWKESFERLLDYFGVKIE